MKKKRGIGLILLALTLFLAACGSGSVSKKGINEISHKDLLKQLDNNETFWLITLDADPKLVKDSGILDEFKKQIARKGIEGAAYLNTYDLTEEEKTELGEEYSYSRYNDWYNDWDYERGGLVLVSNGSMIQTPYTEASFYDTDFAEKRYEDLFEIIELNIKDLFEDLDTFDIDY